MDEILFALLSKLVLLLLLAPAALALVGLARYGLALRRAAFAVWIGAAAAAIAGTAIWALRRVAEGTPACTANSRGAAERRPAEPPSRSRCPISRDIQGILASLLGTEIPSQ